MKVDLNLVKKHLNVEEDFTEDDLYIEHLFNAAYLAVQNYIDISLELIERRNGGKLPPTLLQAILLLTANLYNNRESYTNQTVNELPQSLKWILDQYKCYFPWTEYSRCVCEDFYREVYKAKEEKEEEGGEETPSEEENTEEP